MVGGVCSRNNWTGLTAFWCQKEQSYSPLPCIPSLACIWPLSKQTHYSDQKLFPLLVGLVYPWFNELNWLRERSEKQQATKKKQGKCTDWRSGYTVLPFQQQQAGKSAQPSHLTALPPPSWQLASFQRENKPRWMWSYLPSWQLFLLGLTAHFSLVPASLNRLQFIVQSSSTEIGSIKIHQSAETPQFKLHH